MGLNISRQGLDIDAEPDYYGVYLSYGSFNKLREQMGTLSGFDMSKWRNGIIVVTDRTYNLHILPFLQCSGSSAVFSSHDCSCMIRDLELASIPLDDRYRDFMDSFIRVMRDCIDNDDNLEFC